MITHFQYINTYGGNDEEQHAQHVAYYQQFVTPTVKDRLEAFLANKGKIQNLSEVDWLAAHWPEDVKELMLQAEDYYSLGGMVCVYKTAYELRQEEVAHITTDPWVVERNAGHAYGIDYRKHLHYTLPWLKQQPTLRQGHCDNLKVERPRVRVWLSRMTVADGMPYDNQVCIEIPDPHGTWHQIDMYRPKGGE